MEERVEEREGERREGDFSFNDRQTFVIWKKKKKTKAGRMEIAMRTTVLEQQQLYSSYT